MKKYVVLWHEENESGQPRHVMGESEVFATQEAANAWIEGAIEEDKQRAEQNGAGELLIDKSAGFGIIATHGNSQDIYYCIDEIDVDPPGVGVTTTYDVVVTFEPALHVAINAKSAEDAVRTVNEMIDSRAFKLTDTQKSSLLNDLCENVKGVKVLTH